MGPTSYFRSANQGARVFAWPQKISIRLKSQSVINTGNDRTPAEAKNSAQISPRSNTKGNTASRRLEATGGTNDTAQTWSSYEQKGSHCFFLHWERGPSHV